MLIAITSRSTTRARKLATLPSRQISVRMVSPGKTGAEKRPAMRGQPRRIVAAERLQQRVAGDAEGGKPMQDRPRKARRLGEVGLGVQRIDSRRDSR